MGKFVKFVCVALAMSLALFGCGDDDSGGDGGTSTSDATETSAGPETTVATASGPAPGVTDDTVKIGITYVDTEALLAVNLDYNLGDHKAVYQALIDDINDNGGINGRQIEPIYAPIDPTSDAPAEAACIKLTQDDEVFLITGFLLSDAVLCPVDKQETAVAAGTMTPERIEKAKAPWLTWQPDTDRPAAVLRALDERGELDGRVAVFVTDASEEILDGVVAPVLDELGVDVVETGVVSAPVADPVALDVDISTIAETFAAADADTIVIVGADGATWPQYMADDPTYAPKLLFLDVTAARAFATSGETTDWSILDGSLSGGGYGPDQAIYDEASMQDCVDIITAAGAEAPPPDDFDTDDTSNQPYQAAFQACPDMALVHAWLDAAGEDLNYGTLEAAIDGLEVAIPGDPTLRVYGPPPDADGDAAAFLYGWDAATKGFVLEEG